jgi:hypothetical protein
VSVEKVRFDEQIAARYDETSTHMYRSEVLDSAVDFLEELAADGAALEFGVGTGRVALPLSGRGVPVHGIDISEPMLEQLRLDPRAFHRREPLPRLGLGEGRVGAGGRRASAAGAQPRGASS